MARVRKNELVEYYCGNTKCGKVVSGNDKMCPFCKSNFVPLDSEDNKVEETKAKIEHVLEEQKETPKADKQRKLKPKEEVPVDPGETKEEMQEEELVKAEQPDEAEKEVDVQEEEPAEDEQDDEDVTEDIKDILSDGEIEIASLVKMISQGGVALNEASIKKQLDKLGATVDAEGIVTLND